MGAVLLACTSAAATRTTLAAQTTKRTGWIRSGVAGPESIADHMYRMSLMALLAGDAGVDTNRCCTKIPSGYPRAVGESDCSPPRWSAGAYGWPSCTTLQKVHS